MDGKSSHLLTRLVVLLTAVSTVVAGVPQSSAVPCRKDGERLVVGRQAPGRGENAVKPRSGENSEKLEEEEDTSPEVELLADRAVVVACGDDGFSYVHFVEVAIGHHLHSPKSSIRGPPAA